ncbi:MAG TPA: gamma-glutamyl-gamma-aminobutyrate hydrolase family protein [Marmoricola sp.]|nr:gamma-glutamyl-gamma-aminobutyrate hydrolase family protein [Marmoricola sp.]
MNRPVIGLTAYREEARWGVWSTRADILPAVYASAIEEAGGVPVLLPVGTSAPESAKALVARLDGLVISGGADVSPERYEEAPHPRTASWRDDRDLWELELVDAAEQLGTPLLGICRGMQVMAVAAGGALHQHVPDLVGDETHSPGEDAFGPISLKIAADSLLGALVGERLDVRCHHHQAVREHPSYDAVAWAEDGTLEAMEQRGDRFCLGVQWHPEMTEDAGLFTGVVEAARRFGAG